MKALEKDRNRRYETANGFAADVQRYLADEPVQACPPSAWYRFRKFARRNRRAVATAAAAALVVVLGVAGLATSTLLIARRAASHANRPTSRDSAKYYLEKGLERERHESYFHRITLAHRELSVDNLAGALKLLDDCPKDLREWEWDYLVSLAISNARNSSNVFRKPLAHLLIRPRPLNGMGVATVVLRPRGGDMGDELLPTRPRPAAQVMVAEGVVENFSLIKPRRVGRCEPRTPPTTT